MQRLEISGAVWSLGFKRLSGRGFEACHLCAQTDYEGTYR